MATTSKTKYAILGMLVLHGPCSGYDIKKRIEESIGYFWNESYGNLYPILRRLEDESLATRRVEVQTGRPNRNVFTITEAGTAELTAWLQQPADPQPVRNEMLLKLIYGEHSGVETARGHVRDYATTLQSLLDDLEQIEESAKDSELAGTPSFVYGISALRLGLAVTRARLGWCHETLDVLDSVDDSPPAG